MHDRGKLLVFVNATGTRTRESCNDASVIEFEQLPRLRIRRFPIRLLTDRLNQSNFKQTIDIANGSQSSFFH